MFDKYLQEEMGSTALFLASGFKRRISFHEMFVFPENIV